MTKSKFGFLKDIRFWIFIFFIIRLYGITDAPLEHSHNWRQCTGLMVSRNFLEIDNNILYPRVDDNYGYSGIVGMEFPIMNYIVYLISKVFGFTWWYGRILNLIITSIGIFYFFKIIEKFFDKKIAFYSTLVLLSSIWFVFARKFMPDTFSLSITIISLWYGFLFLEKGKLIHWGIFFILTFLGIMSKIPAIFLLSLYIIPIVKEKKINLRRKIIFSFSFIPTILAVWFWYFYWNPHLSNEYHLWYNSGRSLSEGFYELTNNLNKVAERFYFDGLKSYIGLLTIFLGIFFMIKLLDKLAWAAILILTSVFFIYMIKSGYFFYHHDYYIIPYVPVMALIAGYGISKINAKLRFFLIALVIIESLLNQQHDLTNKLETYRLNLEVISDSISSKSDLIAVNGKGNPQELFLSHRKGWTLSNENIIDTVTLRNIKEKGCKFIYINKHECNDKLPKGFNKVFENEDYIIFSINQ
ncbi:MAG TPA: glycosyltransferase family 39 protein [Bacteroidales bacterium]|nr:glycosyltransferase family 39 protein [Bacteroidales bacterium]